MTANPTIPPDGAKPDRYVPNGRPCTPRQREILTVLMEECAEVIQAASKLVRFGVENRPVDSKNGDRAISNVEYLGLEIGDLRYMLAMTAEGGLSDAHAENAGERRKHDRMRWYMQSEPDPA